MENEIFFYVPKEDKGYDIVFGHNVNHAFPVHTHRKCCIGIIIEGEAVLYQRSQSRLLYKGDMYFIRALEPHSIRAADERGFNHMVLCFEESALSDEGGFPSRDDSLYSGEMKGICDFLERNTASKLSLEEIAREALLSKYHFLRKFKQCTGVTPHDFQMQSRIREAQKQLMNGIPIIDVAMLLGFSDQSHFNRYFKRYLGVNPSKYASNVIFI